MTSQPILFLLVQYFVYFLQFKGLSCYPQQSFLEDSSQSMHSPTPHPTIFDSRVLNKVKTLYTRSILLNAAAVREETGQKKSIIETTDTETALHVKIDPRKFGQTLLSTAEENAARKSDIYMNKAIDATALGVAVLKLIFGKDAKMIMKDSKDSSDVKASLRTNEFRPAITSWSTPRHEATGERNSFSRDHTPNPQKSDKISQLNLNILKLVKSLQPVRSGAEKSSGGGEKGTLNDETVKSKESRTTGFSSSESNLARLLSLMEKTKNSMKQQKGEKKSWVLLKVPTKQPQDELGMLSDPTKSEETSSDASSHHDEHEEEGQPVAMVHQNQHDTINHRQQSNERQSLTSSTSLASKTLKSEPVQEVNPVKTDTTAHVSYEDSINNLLKALETTTHKQSLNHVSSHLVSDKSSSPPHQKVNLVPVKKTEEHAASKDVLAGANTGGAVVSLDALRQLGQLLGLSAQHSRISPYTGTQDTLTLATEMPPQALQATTPAPTPPPAPPPITPPTSVTAKSNLEYRANQEMSLNRISEQLKMFAERGLRGHNEYRKLHHAEPLKWSEDLASAAEKLAYQAAKKGTTTRSELVEKKGYGENVAKISNVALENAGEEATRHWYNEREHFTFSDPSVGDETKAFTQIIWKGTKTVGMGAAKDDDTGELYVVALYNPKGNDEGMLRENIQSDGKEHTDVYASIFKKSNPVRHE